MNEILITGGSGKIGFQLVNHFLNQGYCVITTTRDKTRFINKTKLAKNQLINLKFIEIDFMKEEAIQKIILYLTNTNLNPVSIIHNARSLDFLKIEDDTSVSNDNFLNELFLDVVFPYKLTLEILKHTDKLENVVFISSMYGIVAPTPSLYKNFHESSPINYGVSKAAQIHLTKELAVRLAPKVRVNCISFGGIKGRVDDDFLERYKKLNPQGKMMEENDVIGPVDFLISKDSQNMTGQNIIVDGGWTVW
jgi:NAD(P)-dependent dehydrogenase (short-subunit alcohol dehydrogenase family)